MVAGEYDLRRLYPPVLQKREERYFVLNDGIHRSIAAKAVGLDELYVEV